MRRDGDSNINFIPSPIQLIRIEDMGAMQNVDAIGLGDILGDPLIRECWNFNYLFDLGFVMQHFDSDVRHMVKVKIVHGFWRRDDERRIELLEAAERYPNIELLSAYIPDPFGTHHSKMLILFRHDDTAQIIIHTANMIYRDWSNMTQAVWSSPMLPLSTQKWPTENPDSASHPVGSGLRFKVDLLRYLAAYERRTKDLVSQLAHYDFFAIRAAFIGSVPSRQNPDASKPSEETSFGWLGLREILTQVPVARRDKSHSPPHIVTQISSIATLGAQPTWLTHFQSVLSSEPKVSNTAVSGSTKTASASPKHAPNNPPPPTFSIIFPTPEELRTCLDGYASGASIHWKLQSAQQQKQLAYMHPFLRHWHSPAPTSPPQDSPRRAAHRGPAAPHIKTYIRFSNQDHTTIDWALLTSANLSKQAWGDVVGKKNEMRVQSWEAGVVLWPALFAHNSVPGNRALAPAIMVPVFARDAPLQEDLAGWLRNGSAAHNHNVCADRVSPVRNSAVNVTVVGFRMPYDLPLCPYTADEMPWCATMRYAEPDGKGMAWSGY
ncbi:hypothetical protein IAQ61_002325 [Plenodomus lingam]|uniref:uncharacterized protein n=1 Tax=Leptosphaeria maculans TaxID=5022 RepID=UPI003331257B|nr:hypothetical protein IAQ61_002325 [Plenodomus lingam]